MIVFPSPVFATNKVTLQLRWDHNFIFAGFYAAVEKGFYNELGLEVQFIEGSATTSSVDEVVAGNAQFGISNSKILIDRFKGKPVVALATIFQHSPLILLTRKDTDVKNLHDLVGKRVFFNKTRDVEIAASFIGEGIPFTKLQFVDRKYSIDNYFDSTISGIAAFSTNQPYFLIEKNIPFTVLHPSTYGIDFYGDCLFTTEREIKEHPNRVKAFLEASLRGWEYALQEPEVIINLLLTKYNVKENIEHLRYTATQVQKLVQPDLIEIGHMNPGRWRHMADTFAKLKLISPNYSIEKFIYNPNLVQDYTWLFRLLIITIVASGFLSLLTLFLSRFNKKLRTEVHERKKVEVDLRESENRFKTLHDASFGGIAIHDEGIVLDCNQGLSNITGFSIEELIGMDGLKLIAPQWREPVMEKIQSGFKHPYEVEGLRKDNTKFYLRIQAKNIPYHGRTVRVTEFRDITERRLAEKEKLDAQKIAAEQKQLALVGQVAGKMAHDFNNILGIVMGNAELSLLSCEDPETKKTLELIFKQTLRGRNLTRNLVAFAKSQEPKQEFFKISDKIDFIINLLKKDLAGIELIKENEQNIPDLLADPGMIEHALVNLFQNSIHALGKVEDPKIIIRTYCLENNIYFKIEDNGCGIPSECLDRIYEPSFTLKGTKDVQGQYKEGIRGTGYGMANVKKYIEQHKGKVFVESEFGVGTTITVGIPVIKKELTNEEKIEIREEIVHSEKYILLIEDESAISDVQYKILTHEPCNHKVDIAATGQLAVDLFNRNKYNFVSLDYVLPGGINGMDVYNHIRKSNKSIPILFVSGNLDFLESIRELKNNDPYVDHVSKPCQNKYYVESINKLLEQALAEP